MLASLDNTLVRAVIDAAARPDVMAAMQAFYADADRCIAAQPATCWNRGDCCRFGQYGHRLYVTALEVCYYWAAGDDPLSATEDACPHAVAGKCNARNRRPLACRVFYCDPNAQAWQGPLSEKRLAQLRALHDELDVPYFYADWLAVLRALHRAGQWSRQRHPNRGNDATQAQSSR